MPHRHLSWFKPSRELSPTQPLAPWWDGERIVRVKVRKLMGWDKDSLISKAKATHTSKAKQGIHSPLPISRQVQPSPGKQGSITHNSYLGRQMPSPRTSPLPTSSLSFICWTWCHRVWNIPVVSWSQLSQLCPLPTSCALQPTWGDVRSRKVLDSV